MPKQLPKEIKTIEDAFSFAHADVCWKKIKGKEAPPYKKRSCGRQLFRYLTKLGEKLDPEYNHKRIKERPCSNF